MLPRNSNYNIYPSVVPSGKSVEMVIAPAEKAFLFFDGDEYRLEFFDLNSDMDVYYTPVADDVITVTASDGVLRFDYSFDGEQEHLIRMFKGDKKIMDLTVFSLYEDLYKLRPIRGDFHSHSYRSDGKRDPSTVAAQYRENGYDFFALTDHNRFYPGGEIDETYEGVNTGFFRVCGEEVHTPGSIVHIVHVGGRESVANIYIHERERYEREVEECLTRVPANVPEKLKLKYARAMWATERIHDVGGLAIFPHPYWRPRELKYNVCDELSKLFLSSGMFDAYELIGGMDQVGNNRSVALWSETRAEGARFSVVGSSDVHETERSSHFPNNFTICFAKDASAEAAVEAVRLGNTVAVRSEGYEYDKTYSVYGSLRLVAYAHFLLKYYFPNQERLSSGVGVAMRAYSMGEAGSEVIELQAELVEKYRARFFGKEAPVLPDAKMIDFENRWRKTHIEVGPITKGSAIDSEVVTRQI